MTMQHEEAPLSRLARKKDGSGSGMFRLFDASQAAERFAGLVRESATFRAEVAAIPQK